MLRVLNKRIEATPWCFLPDSNIASHPIIKHQLLGGYDVVAHLFYKRFELHVKLDYVKYLTEILHAIGKQYGLVMLERVYKNIKFTD